MKNTDIEIRKQYWQEFTKACEKHKAPLKPNVPSGAPNAVDVNLGPNLNLNLRATAVLGARIPGSTDSDNITVRISVAKELWESLEGKWENIEAKFDESRLQCIPVNKGKFLGGQQIFIYKANMDPRDESDWNRQFQWFILTFWRLAEILRELFHPSLKPFDCPFVSNRPSDQSERNHFEEDIGNLLDVVKKEIELLDEQISALNRRRSELQDTLSNYE